MRDHITVSGQRCEVKRLVISPRERSQGHPCGEVFAPDGYEFSGGETSLCVHADSDLLKIEEGEQLSAAE